MSVESESILSSAVAVFGRFRYGVGGISALRGFDRTFVMAVNYLLGVTHATVADFVMVFRLTIFSKFVIFRSVSTRLKNLCQILLLTFLLKGGLVPDNVVTLLFSLSVGCAGLIF